MSQKVLEKGSPLAEKLDTNGDGIITDKELMMKERMVRLENQDKKEDQQRYMVWFSALAVTAYIIVLMTPIVPLERLDHLSSIGSTWVISNMGIIGAFIASNAFIKKNGNGEK
tara:strand:- start:7741 stop:8079 length:339 start_codon:yes stop_codon:yes gene_type:complete